MSTYCVGVPYPWWYTAAEIPTMIAGHPTKNRRSILYNAMTNSNND